MATSAKSVAIAKWVLIVFAGALIGVNLYAFNAKTLVRDALPMPFGVGAAVVMSGSMEPALSVDDLVFVQQTDTVAAGDIIVYQSGGDLVIHRVIDVEGDTITTQGDANNSPDTPINATDVKGKMVAVVPGAGAVVRVLQNPVVVICVALAAVLLIELPHRRRRGKHLDDVAAIKQEIAQLQAQVNGEGEVRDAAV